MAHIMFWTAEKKIERSEKVWYNVEKSKGE
jgi:hypothetical protein